MKLLYTKEARDEIRGLAPEIKQGIRRTLEELRGNPYLGKPLRVDLKGFYSLPFKRYRVLYKIELAKQTIQIYSIGHRSTVYTRFSAVLKKRH